MTDSMKYFLSAEQEIKGGQESVESLLDEIRPILDHINERMLKCNLPTAGALSKDSYLLSHKITTESANSMYIVSSLDSIDTGFGNDLIQIIYQEGYAIRSSKYSNREFDFLGINHSWRKVYPNDFESVTKFIAQILAHYVSNVERVYAK